jgi:hypothetical protein
LMRWISWASIRWPLFPQNWVDAECQNISSDCSIIGNIIWCGFLSVNSEVGITDFLFNVIDGFSLFLFPLVRYHPCVFYMVHSAIVSAHDWRRATTCDLVTCNWALISIDCNKQAGLCLMNFGL